MISQGWRSSLSDGARDGLGRAHPQAGETWRESLAPSFPAEISGLGVRTTVGTMSRGDPVPVANRARVWRFQAPFCLHRIVSAKSADKKSYVNYSDPHGQSVPLPSDSILATRVSTMGSPSLT